MVEWSNMVDNIFAQFPAVETVVYVIGFAGVVSTFALFRRFVR